MQVCEGKVFQVKGTALAEALRQENTWLLEEENNKEDRVAEKTEQG